MSSKDEKRAPEPERRMSRRSLLQGAATAGAAGLAVSALGAAVASPALASTGEAQAHHDTRTPDGPITVHVRDTRSGDIEVFSGTSATRLRDKDLAARIARTIV